MNIYLDIDGVLLISEDHLAPGANEFLQAVVSRYPESTYWLTTHVWKGENRVNEVLTSKLQPETQQLIQNIKPTDWGDFKTDAIDFNQPLLWFDDDLYPEEKEVLEEHNALDSFVHVNLHQNPDSLKNWLTKL